MKKLFILVVVIFMMFSITGCSKSKENDAKIKQQEDKIESLNNKIKSLQKQKADLDDIITQEKIDKNVAQYLVTINIKQSHFTLNISKHIKDAMNDINIQIPVSKDFYDSVEVGTVIDDSFRMGSLLMEGSVGNWDITITGKEIK